MYLEICTSIGCNNSPYLSVVTDEDVPEFQNEPNAYIISTENNESASVEIKWTKPIQPNGLIRRYRLERAPKYNLSDVYVIYEGSEFQYQDTGLLFNQNYCYKITSFNSMSVGVSSGWKCIDTVESAPFNVFKPVIIARSSNSITVSLSLPGAQKTNGKVISYNVQVNGSRETLMPNKPYEIKNLLPFTNYSLNIVLCTDKGCTNSQEVLIQTYADTPSTITNCRSDPSINWILLHWKLPTRINGIFNGVRLFYKSAEQSEGELVEGNIFIPDSHTLSYNITGLKPYTKYSFRFTVTNNFAKSDYSKWFNFYTKSTVAEFIKDPVITRKMTSDNKLIYVFEWTKTFQLNAPLEKYIFKLDTKLSIELAITSHSVYRDSLAENMQWQISAITNISTLTTPLYQMHLDEQPYFSNYTPPTTSITTAEPITKATWFIPTIVVCCLLVIFVIALLIVVLYRRKNNYASRERKPLNMAFSLAGSQNDLYQDFQDILSDAAKSVRSGSSYKSSYINSASAYRNAGYHNNNDATEKRVFYGSPNNGYYSKDAFKDSQI